MGSTRTLGRRLTYRAPTPWADYVQSTHSLATDMREASGTLGPYTLCPEMDIRSMFILFTSTGILPTACSRVQCNLPAVSTSVQCSPTWAASVWKNTFLARHSRPIFSTGCGQANGKPGHEALSKQPPLVTNHHHVRYYLETAQIACLRDHKCTIDYPCSSSYPSVIPPGGFL